MYGHPDLVRELKSLRKGRGVLAGEIERRVGPALRAACGITDRDGPVAIREKVRARLVELIGRLPDDLSLVTRVAFAIDSDARQALYQERVHWAAVQLDRESRTVRRRVDDAINQLAELAAAPAGQLDEPAAGWHTAELRAVVALDLPEVLEQRRIVADRDGLRELDIAAPFPDVRVLYGGTLVDGPALALPAPLLRGDEHDFAVAYRLPSADALRSYLVSVPRPCALFDLRVRFGPDRVPPCVWTLTRAHPDDRGQQHPVDRAGEIHLRYRGLIPGLVYGARWDLAGSGQADAAGRCGACGR